MHRYLFGIILLQIVTIAIFWLNAFAGDGLADTTNSAINNLDISFLLRVAIPCLLLAVTTAFWFASIGRSGAERAIARLQDRHAKEREKIQISAEKAKSRLLEQTHKEINKQTRRASNKANFKVGLAFVAAAGAGLVMIITELVTLGMMTMMTAGGALGGYVMRGRREKSLPRYVESTGTATMDTAASSGEPNSARLTNAGSSDEAAKGSQVRVINPDDVVG